MQLFANAARTVTTAAMAAGGTAIPVADATRFPTGGTGDWFRLVLESATDPTVFEVVTARRTGATELTAVARAQEGTAAQDWPMGTIAGLRVTAADMAGAALQAPEVKSAAFTAANGGVYLCNTSAAAFTMTLPASPQPGWLVTVYDYASTFDLNNLTVGRNGSNVLGQAEDYVLDQKNHGRTFRFADATKGWVVS